jgi:hypothetical protein
MATAVDDLPGDADELRAAVLAIRVAPDAERALRQRLEDQNERLRHFIRQLQRMQFGRRSEKLDPDQLNLALEDLEQSTAEADAEAEKGTRRCVVHAARNGGGAAAPCPTICRGSRW